jgi:hypothetical protein
MTLFNEKESPPVLDLGILLEPPFSERKDGRFHKTLIVLLRFFLKMNFGIKFFVKDSIRVNVLKPSAYGNHKHPSLFKCNAVVMTLIDMI